MFQKFIILFALIIGEQSFACPRDFEKLICPGDYVINEKGYAGTVKAVNPFVKTAAVQWTLDPQGYSINSTSTWNISDLALSLGCLEGFCMGDTVISPKNFTGQIIGVNPYLGKVAVRWTEDPNGYSINSTSTWTITKLALGYGCSLGYCIGDFVVNIKGYSGTIVGINHFTDEAAVLWTLDPNGYSIHSTSIWKIESLSNSKYCEEYGNYDRSLKSSLEYGRKILSHKLMAGFKSRYYID